MDRRWLKSHLLENRPVGRDDVRNCRRLFVCVPRVADESSATPVGGWTKHGPGIAPIPRCWPVFPAASGGPESVALALLLGRLLPLAAGGDEDMLRKVRDVMHRGVVTCKVTATADQIAGIMLDNDVSAVVVVDERLDACGVVTKTDLIGCYGKDLASLTAEDVMSLVLHTVSPDTLVWQAVEQMLACRVHQLVIVTQGGAHRRPVGIFTSGDAVALMAGESGPRSDAQIRCSDCIRRLLSVAGDEGTADRARECATEVPQPADGRGP